MGSRADDRGCYFGLGSFNFFQEKSRERLGSCARTTASYRVRPLSSGQTQAFARPQVTGQLETLCLRSIFNFVVDYIFCVCSPGSCHKRKKPQAPTPQAPVANVEVRNRYTNLTSIMLGLPFIWRFRTLAFATFIVWRLRIGAFGVGACGF